MDSVPTKLKLKPCPASGEGCHAFLYYASCRAVEAGLTDEEAIPIIADAMTRAPSPPDEIESALRSARREDKPIVQKWPYRDCKLIAEIVAGPEPPWVIIDPFISVEPAIDLLFPGDPLLCIGKSSSRFCTKPRSEWRSSLKYNSLIVPSPMTALQGRTKAGHFSDHSLENTGPRHYIICEWDWGTKDSQLKLGWHLAQFAPLAACVFSGGKSHHFWFRCKGETEETVLTFFKKAVSLGCDNRMFSRSSFVRLPGGTRDNGAAQPIIYFNPSVICPTHTA